MHKEELTDGQSLRGFALATIAFLAIFAATAIPIPLYADYQATIGLTTADISNTMFTYLTGVALTLLLAGRISDAFGRTPVTSLTLMLAIVGCIMFMMADSGAAVLAARFVQGLSAGFGMSAVSALVIDCVGEKTPRLGVHRGQLRRHGGHHDRVGGRGHPLRHRAEHRRALRHHDRHPGRVPVPHARGARAPRPDALAARRDEGARLHPHRQPAPVRRGGRVLPGHLARLLLLPVVLGAHRPAVLRRDLASGRVGHSGPHHGAVASRRPPRAALRAQAHPRRLHGGRDGSPRR